jgi:membrane fusion protein, copper/silver efflux system
MMTRSITIVLFSAALVAAFIGGALVNAPATHAGQAERKVLYWQDPMHPEYRADKPGIAPDCGMQLEPVTADGSGGGPPPRQDVPAGTVRIDADQQQLIGVRTEVVTRSDGRETVRTLGRVAPDERRVYRLSAFANGWIRQTYDNSVGSQVRRDEALATFYAREFLAAQQSYFYALDALDRRAGTPELQLTATRAQVQGAADSLQALGMSDIQIADLAKTRQPTQEIEIRSPAAGFIMARNVSPGQRIDGGQELFVIADLRRVWVLADMFRQDADFIRAGQPVRLSLPHQAREFDGRVSEVLPKFDPATRTLKVRIEVDNPAYALRPDMLVDVRFPIRLPAALTVPADAVLDSGVRQTVFVDRGEGHYEPRAVQTGWRSGDRVEIRDGLVAGERVVIAGNFLIDSESRLKAAAAGIRGEPARDPICGMDVDQAGARREGLVVVHQGRARYFCSRGCKADFEASPAKYAGRS